MIDKTFSQALDDLAEALLVAESKAKAVLQKGPWERDKSLAKEILDNLAEQSDTVSLMRQYDAMRNRKNAS